MNLCCDPESTLMYRWWTWYRGGGKQILTLQWHKISRIQNCVEFPTNFEKDIDQVCIFHDESWGFSLKMLQIQHPWNNIFLDACSMPNFFRLHNTAFSTHVRCTIFSASPCKIHVQIWLRICVKFWLALDAHKFSNDFCGKIVYKFLQGILSNFD